MRRLRIAPRRNWQEKVESVGLVYHSPNGQPYWDEFTCYSFTAREIDELEAATEEVQRLCLSAGQLIIDNNRFQQLRIPDAVQAVIRQAWEAEPPSIYGRFDFAYDGKNPPKLLEYNANTPTGLLEAAVAQWHWRQEVFPATDQFNSIHDKLVAKWTDLRSYLKGKPL
jgi:glutathionylspermidine synthase